MRGPRACLLAAVIGCVLMSVVAVRAQKPSSSAPSKSALSSDSNAVEIRRGERIFHANCGRCHQPPEDLSPREARAVVRQMRVRANLSEKDERALLKFLAP